MGLRTFSAQLKDLFFPRYLTGASSALFFGPSRTQYNYAADVADGLMSSVVMPVVQWMMRSFPEAPVILQRRVRDALEPITNHPLPALLERPNAFYSGAQLWMNTVLDWCCWGESYWRIIEARGGRPAELWWLPPWSIQPQWPADGSIFISHYVYGPETQAAKNLSLEEVVHFRHGLDPRNIRHGLPPLRAILQDIWVDLESNNFVGAMLRNMGIPGMIISPKGEAQLSEAEVERVKAYISSRFTGDRRGQPLALGAPTDVHKLSLSPTELDMSALRNTAEERVSAALGIPAAVVGFGTGLESTKVGATMTEMRKLAWHNGIVPVQRIMAAELQRVLLPWYETDIDRFRVGWDYHAVQALQEDENAKATRLVALVGAAILKRSEARDLLGHESDASDEVYHLANSVTEIQDGEPLREPVAPVVPALPVNGNENGNSNGARNGNGRVATRALKQGSMDEWITGLIGRHVQRMETPPRAVLRLANRLWRAEQALQPKLQARVVPVLKRYGQMAGTAAREVLVPRKQELVDYIRSQVILERIPFVAVRAELAEVYTALYQEMADLTLRAIQEATTQPLPDPASLPRQLSLAARERVALLDLPTDAKTAILEILDAARTAGLDEDTMIGVIQDKIPAGRWTSVEMRAQVLARTESRFAANLTTAEYARQSGAKLLVFDARLGNTDATCEERNGWIVTPSQAQVLSGLEHPNGTLGFAPLIGATVSIGGMAE